MQRAMSVFSTAASTGVCVFCKRDDNDITKYGGIKSTRDTKAHYFCLLLSTKIKQSGSDSAGILGFLQSDIREELERTENVNCCYCNKPHATIYCARVRCKKVFHLPCGMENRSSHSFLHNFGSYCHKHRQIQKISISLTNSLTELSCLICFEQFKKDDVDNVLWPSCCHPQGLFHRFCVQRYTISAGYYTKCPTCNDEWTFVKCCKEFGIFVPEQDAAWEREPDAFSELHNTDVYECSFDKCICFRGRNYNNPYGRWRIINCCSCGAFGAHFACIKTANTNSFTCKDCKEVCKKFGYSETPRSDSETQSSDDAHSDNESYEIFVIGLRRMYGTANLHDLPTTSQINDNDNEDDKGGFSLDVEKTEGNCDEPLQKMVGASANGSASASANANATVNGDKLGLATCLRTSSADSVVVNFNELAIERELASTESISSKESKVKVTWTSCDKTGEDITLENEASGWTKEDRDQKKSVEENNNGSHTHTTNEEPGSNGASRKREVENTDPPSKKIHKSNN